MNDIVYRSYENCRRPGVAILDMQMSKVPIISGYGEKTNTRRKKASRNENPINQPNEDVTSNVQ
jgi:hypothetical protein